MDEIIKELDEIIERMTTIRDKVAAHPQPSATLVGRNSTTRGARTQPKDFYLPILRALKDRPDGSARVRDVRESVWQEMKDRLTTRDLERLPGGQHELVWVRTMSALVADALLS